ncbi:fibulin-1 isoform X1 [Drosophila subobscura]|uniref:fibulin-1 isoform X1 n=1 Tax=Drosophila subobscura TaxID=7241 RepID=UPI00155A204B|nr:fibulin-1 isoform X1 [Drosophila subobscura]
MITSIKFGHIWFMIYILMIWHNADETLASDNISDYIRKCCISGLRHARTMDSCENIDSSASIIPPLWLGLCHSTQEVCCSRELDHKNCELGRLAALNRTRCDKDVHSNCNAYAGCCRACQVGLAVKASKQNCSDPLFSFLSAIESYRACCNEDSDLNSKSDEGLYISQQLESDLGLEEDLENSSDGTIVLTDDDDICGKIPNLCAHICENTFDAYQCKCHSGFQLDNNNVTCSSEKKSICPDGYYLDHQHGKCLDIDECSEKLHDCLLTQYCHNTIGGYHCLNIKLNKCPSGYHYAANVLKCEDDNECEESPSPCEPDQQCSNYAGGFNCTSSESQSCDIGFYLEGGICSDINECTNNTTHTCHAHLQECLNTLGSFSCQCQMGFRLDITQNECVDINECSINNHNCLPTQRCDNTIGSYICTRLQSCGTGYTLNAETGICDDDDECELNTHNCQPNFDCYNTKGSFRCYRKTTTSTTTTATPSTTSSTATPTFTEPVSRTHYSKYPYPLYSQHGYYGSTISRLPCSTGFHRNNLGACVDINECVENNPCGTHQRCINTNGHFRCESLLQCKAGYKSTPEGTSCIDINECETGEHNCGDRQICRNRNGSYICACPTGHELKHLSNGVSTCQDIDECAQDQRVCPSNSHCFNTIGSFYCECKPGFQKKTSDGDESNTACLDVDECSVIPGLCQQKCVNFWGGYRCSCNSGYQLGQDNRTCNDIDECEVHKHYKLCMGLCINTSGSYQCNCPRGYTLASDMNTCRDIDECADSVNDVCTGRNDICTNIRGSFKCTTVNCPYGYTNDLEQKNRCRQNNNFCEGEDCYTKPSAYTYNFITFVSKLMIPPDGRTIFTLRGPMWYDNIDFDLKIVRIQASINIERATENHFDTLKSNNQVNLLLKRSLEGPQDIEMELSMTVFTNGMPRGKSVAKLFLFVSQHPF